MRGVLAGLGVLVTLGLGYWLGLTPPPAADAPDAGAGAPAETVWTCSMDPQVALPAPGPCPICGMDLIPRAAATGGADPARFTLSPEAARLARVRTAPVERRAVTHTLRLVGDIGYDRTRLADITAWFGGRIERMFVDYEGMRIHQGDHLYRIFSPALITAHSELLQAQRAIKRLGGASPMVRESAEATLDAVQAKLRRWGLSSYQIKQLGQRQKASDQITLYAPTGGVVIERAKVEGTYVETGTRLYRIADLDWVWIEAWAYEHHLPWLRFGQTVTFTVDAVPGRTFQGRVSFIDPYLDPTLRANRLRISVANPDGLLKPGMFARVEVQAQLAGEGRLMAPELAGQFVCPMHPHVMDAEPDRCSVCGMPMVKAESLGYAVPDPHAEPPLVIPATAPLLTGTRAVVYVVDQGAEEPTYVAREVVLGPRAGDDYVVLEGLMLGEQVVAEGAFKLDSELQIRGGPSMMNPLAAPPASMATSGPTSAASGPTRAPAPASGPHAGHEHTPAPAAKAPKAPRAKAKKPAARPKPTPKVDAPAPLAGALKATFAAYLRTQAALAADDAAGAATHWGAVGAAIKAADLRHPTLAPRAEALRAAAKGGGDIKALRKAFHRLSLQLVPLLRAEPAAGATAATVFHCPMAFDNGADWLQAGGGKAMNPYFGAKMLHCGRRVARVAP